MTCGVYEIWCGPYFYQGSSKNIERRFEQHNRDLRKKRHCNPKLQTAFDKYGWTSAVVLAECEEHTLLVEEQAYLDTNWGDEKFLNLSPTSIKPMGRKGSSNSAEHRAKIGAAQKGKVLSDEHRAKLSESHKGKTLSIESRAKVSAARKGVPKSPETRAKMSAAHRGKVLSPETRAKISATKKAQAKDRQKP